MTEHRVPRHVAVGVTASGRPRIDRIAYFEGVAAQGLGIRKAAASLGVQPLSIYQLLYRHHRLDLWYALKGDTVTWKRATR